MPVNQRAFQWAITSAYDCWLGTDGAGPERYLYRMASSRTLDMARMTMFCEYWGVDRGNLRKRILQKKLGRHWIAEINRTNTRSDTIDNYNALLERCTNYEGPTRAESAASKFLINFFPRAGYVIDRNAHNAIKSLVRSGRRNRAARFRSFFEREEIVALRQDIAGHLGASVRDHDLNDSEFMLWAGRFIDKYLFFSAETRPDEEPQESWKSEPCELFAREHGPALNAIFAKALDRLG